jgi:hypothetical protein
LDFRLQREVDYRRFVDTPRLFNARFGETNFVDFFVFWAPFPSAAASPRGKNRCGLSTSAGAWGLL